MKATVARILYIPYTEYKTRWHEVYASVFSHVSPFSKGHTLTDLQKQTKAETRQAWRRS